ncbi:MAG: hypothetical protein OEM05_13205 [Myxococcales bacterium]|nr:hypothetical protein [Myxococcales bacterium]
MGTFVGGWSQLNAAGMNIVAIRDAQEAYYAETGSYASALPVTPPAVGSVKLAWGLAPTASTSSASSPRAECIFSTG